MTEKQHIKLVSVGNRFWAKFSRIVAEALAELPRDMDHAEAIPYLQDKTSIYGSTYSEELKKIAKHGTQQPAAERWTKTRPTEPGLYLVQFLCDAFPKGDPNNVCHQLVNIVHDGRVLHDGRFRDESELKGWIWARVNKHA